MFIGCFGGIKIYVSTGAKKYEPKFYKAIVNIFGDSYEYMRAYNEFRREMKQIKG